MLLSPLVVAVGVVVSSVVPVVFVVTAKDWLWIDCLVAVVGVMVWYCRGCD